MGMAGIGSGLIAGCIGDASDEMPSIARETLTLTTTTSTYDTGLLGVLNDAFESRFGASVDAVAQGTGAALQTARNGDADVVLVHARSLEDDFLRDGYGINRRDLMFNDFIVVGPTSDPASIEDETDVVNAFLAIADSDATFISRGDNSGTHQKELEIWDAAGMEPTGTWYRSTGSGMGEVLNQANLTDDAYTIADRGTYLAQRGTLDSLTIHLQGPIENGPDLLANPYGIIAVNPAIHPHVSYDLAMAYIGFITSVEGQELIQSHTVDGEQLFFPEAIVSNPSFQQYVPEGWGCEKP